MQRLGTVLIIVGALVTGAALLALAAPGLREVGLTLLAGVASPRAALAAGVVLLAVGVLLRRRGVARR